MPIELPKADKIYTHVYDNFKGVDFTNDSTNVWHRRSPDGYNMLPDESGRPFKRTGWEVVVSTDDMLDLLTGKEDINILKCSYFELAGLDHIIIFTDGGVFSYVNGSLSLLSTDVDCYSSYDRAYFFEGNGKSAFYIYGNYKVWEYVYENDTFRFDESENFENEEDRITIPTILIATSASECVGTDYEAFNMLGNLARVLYENNDMFRAYTTSTTITIVANKVDFLARKVVASITQVQFEADKTHYYTKSGDAFIQCTESDAWDGDETYYEVWTPTRDTYEFEYDDDNTRWDLTVGGTTTTNVDPAEYGINILGSPSDDDKIVLKYIYGVLLPSNVAQSQIGNMIVRHSVFEKFDEELEVVGYATTPALGQCSLHTDTESQPKDLRKAWLEFYSLEQPVVEEEDAISVVFPITSIDTTEYTGLNSITYTGTCNLVT